MCRILLVVLCLFAMVACNNSGKSESQKDSAGQSGNGAGGENYIMENNVDLEKKKMDTNADDAHSVDSARSNSTATPAVDTIAWAAADTVKK